jgi:protein associated with RNAse G/E
METSREIAVHAKKYDGRVRKTWTGGVVSESDELIVLVAKFEASVEHNDLGNIKAGTISFEHFWLDRWYNIFRFHEPDGALLAYYVNIAMPAELDGEVLSYVDLDIDVIRWPDGRVDVLDRDDFEKNQKKFDYPQDVIDNAEAALSNVLQLIEKGQLP